MSRADPRTWWPDLAVGALVLVLAVVENRTDDYADYHWLLVGLAFAVAAGLARRAPGVALLLVWVTCVVQVVTGVPVLLIELSASVVSFGCARWGREATVVASGLSIPAAAVIAVAVEASGAYRFFSTFAALREFSRGAYRFSDRLLVGAVVMGVLFLAVPWLAGLTLRLLARARSSEVSQVEAQEQAASAQRETEQAREIARLREEQARLARDVHDVVGHSLAVILAQAESAQYLPDDDPDKLKATMATIATSARGSLQDVRQVLAPPGQPTAPTRDGGFEQLLAGVRAGGHEVVATEVGTPQPLPPELGVVAHRVVQEMLTNAVKHGRRDQPILVERHWPQDTLEHDLRLEVSNSVVDPDETQPISSLDPLAGQGLAGMRRRVESVGGRLDVRRRTGPDGPTFTTTAWVPVRA